MPACQAKCRGIWLAPHAERRGLHPNPLVRELIEAALDGDLIDAVLDDMSETA